MTNPRRIALEALLDITEAGAYANLRLKEALTGLPQREARWVSAMVYTTLDHLLYIDYVLAHFAKGRTQPVIRGILRMGVAQLLYMEVPDSAACNESVNLCKKVGKNKLSGYVNGVLRAICRNRENLPPLPDNSVDRLSIQFSWPRWLVDEYVAQYGTEFTTALLDAKAPGMTLRAQYPHTTEELRAALQAANIPFRPGGLVPEACVLEQGMDVARDGGFLAGHYTVQSESAMLVCKLLAPAKGMSLLDACAAPGGKTAYLSHIMQGGGHIEAWELHPHRKALIQKTLERLHVEGVQVQVRDATQLDPTKVQAFDAVLVDAPCSGLGVFGKPDARYAKSDEMIRSLATLQGKIMDDCANYVRPGGALVYATCTISQRENEGQIRSFLAKHREFQPGNMDALPAALQRRAKDGMVQLFPHLDHTEGFFMARLVKGNG